MDRKTFMEELEFLLQDISIEEREEALNFYNDYFDEAGVENEQRVIAELGEPSKVAAIIKDGLRGSFDDHIESGNQGFSNDDYRRNYEVIDVEPQADENHQSSHWKEKWNHLETRDKFILIVIIVLACLPLSATFGGLFGGLFGMAMAFTCLFFGFWIITFVLYILAIVAIIVGVCHLFTLTGAGFIYIGIGCILMAIATIFEKIAKWFFKDCIPSIIDGVSSLFNKIFHNRGVQS